MNYLTKLIVALMTMSSVLLTGCASVGLGNSDVDPRLENNADIEFFSKSGFQACAAGAGLGIAGCLVSNSSNKAECALIAAVAGCGVGMGANAYLDYNRKKFGTEEAALNQAITDLREENIRLARINDINQSVIKDNKVMLVNMQKDLAANRLDAQRASQELATIDANINFLNKTLAKAKERQVNWQKVSNSSSINTEQLDKEIQVMNEKVEALESELNDLFTQRTAIRLS